MGWLGVPLRLTAARDLTSLRRFMVVETFPINSLYVYAASHPSAAIMKNNGDRLCFRTP